MHPRFKSVNLFAFGLSFRVAFCRNNLNDRSKEVMIPFLRDILKSLDPNPLI
jgi:hypothetical protein